MRVIVWTVAATIATAILSGVLYRVGGTSAGTKWRDFGVPALLGIYTRFVLKIEAEWWIYFLAMVALFGALTTYNKWVSKYFGFPDWKTDVYWPSWAFTGLTYGLVAAPFAYVTGAWLGYGIRCVILCVLTGFWSHIVDKVELEEGGRGFFIIATMPLFLI